MQTKTDAATIAKKLIQLADAHDWPATLELVAAGTKARVGGQRMTREEWLGFGQMFYAAFPDGRHDIHEAHTAGDVATIVATFRGTHRGEFMGVPATGKQVAFTCVHVDRVVDGRIVDHQGELDAAGLMQQLTTPEVDLRTFVGELFRRIASHDFDGAHEMIAPDGVFRMGAQAMDRNAWREFSRA